MSPKTPASLLPIASTTATTPAGIASIAARVDFGEDQDSGVAKSSRAGTNLSVKAGPMMRFPAALASGIGPRIHARRTPFFRSTVVMVAVDARLSEAEIPGVSVMFNPAGLTLTL
jgi:hypothetical protein